ncbi:MAG: ATP-binding protein [Clostridia bacterium]|nr:ATP-binding protein [Clostridia bacterium]
MSMNHTLEIRGLGPLEKCKVERVPFMIVTGEQASGKSTVAKTIYFFRTIKEDIVRLAEQRALCRPATPGYLESSSLPGTAARSLRESLEDHLRTKFQSMFGPAAYLRKDMQLSCHYTDDCRMKIFLKSGGSAPDRPCLEIEMSDALRSLLESAEHALSPHAESLPAQKRELQERLRVLFDDPCPVVFIPAGRSVVTVLSAQLLYFYGAIDDSLKRALDYCTRDYVERVLKLRPEFSGGLDGLLIQRPDARLPSLDTALHTARALVRQILRGSYWYADGEERLVTDDTQCVRINNASSGQQESVWVLNLLFYYLVRNRPVLFIIEEPESPLSPESQKRIAELMALVHSQGHSFVATTHSAYVLETLNKCLHTATVENADKNGSTGAIGLDLCRLGRRA